MYQNRHDPQKGAFGVDNRAVQGWLWGKCRDEVAAIARLRKMARPERFELPTKWFEATYSIQLSYGRAGAAVYRKVRPPAKGN